MRLEPHENLMVWSIRQERFGIERFHTEFHHHHLHHQNQHRHCGHVHRDEHCDRWEPSLGLRVVDRSQRSEPADCQPCRCGGETNLGLYPPYKSYLNATPMTEIKIVTIPADIAPPSEPGALQGYIYGQAVPSVGNLLDVMA